MVIVRFVGSSVTVVPVHLVEHVNCSLNLHKTLTHFMILQRRLQRTLQLLTDNLIDCIMTSRSQCASLFVYHAELFHPQFFFVY